VAGEAAMEFALADADHETPLKPPRLTRYIQPLGMRVLVRVLKQQEVHESGLYLPDGAREKMNEAHFAEVIEVARARPEDELDDASLGTNVSGIPCGAKILFAKEQGIRVPWDDSLRLLEVKHVLATVEEVGLDQTH
jgi:co-chaperonin GroES (HSP10)